MTDIQIRVLLAVVSQRRATVRTVAAEVGRTVSTTHRHLHTLRRAGFITWDDDKRGTLRPLVEEV